MRNGRESLQLDKIRYDLAAARVVVKLHRLRIALKYSDPNQPRVPAGQREGGRWSGNTSDPDTDRVGADTQRVAENYSFGTLVAQIPRKIGYDCVYKFDFGHVMVEGMTNLGCSPFVPSAAVRHGVLLNDNFEGR